MTDIKVGYIAALEEECLQSKQLEVKSTSSDELSEESLRCDDRKVKFYTGLPSFSILIAVLNLVSSPLSDTCSRMHSLSVFEQFIATPMKLRLSSFDQDLGYRFGFTNQRFHGILGDGLI